MTKAYANAPTHMQDGTADAKNVWLAKPAVGKVGTLCSFAQDLTAERTELCARPEIGFSELAGTLDDFFVNLRRS